MKQFLITPAAGKRLIGRAMASHPAVSEALKSGSVVVVAGTTNGYVAEEILNKIGQSEGFDRKRFFRGVTLPPSIATTKTGRLSGKSEFPGDVIIVKGKWQKGKTIFDVVDDLKNGDVILKGANAIDLSQKRAAILIGDQKAGTSGVILQAVAGRRVQLILPVGLEKRIFGNLDELANKLNNPKVRGPRLLPVPGSIFTEIDAIKLLTDSDAELVAGGGVGGAEGGVWVFVEGENTQEIEKLMKSVIGERMFEL